MSRRCSPSSSSLAAARASKIATRASAGCNEERRPIVPTRRLFELHRTVVAAVLPQRPDISGLCQRRNPVRRLRCPGGADGSNNRSCHGHTCTGDRRGRSTGFDRSPRRKFGGKRGPRWRALPIMLRRSTPQHGSHERDHAHGFTSSLLQAVIMFESTLSS